MTARRRLAPLAILLFFRLAFLCEGKIYGKQTQHEAQYDEGGNFKTTLDVPGAERAKISGEIREFIWDHWSGHRRARFRLIAQTIEGQVTVHRIFIEPDAQGHWRVRDEAETDTRRGVQPAKPQVTVDEYDQVRRTDASGEQIIPDSEKRAPGTYKLLLINKLKGLQWLF
jgi:hypothetical protein